MYMYDIHMHIIPGVDDGSWDMEMSRRLLFMAYEQGIRKILATPHSSAFRDNTVWEVEKRLSQLKEMTEKFLPDLQLYFGCEIRCGRREMDDILNELEWGRIPSLNGTRYVLAEFSTFVETEEIMECVQRLKKKRWRPVLAHVERYRELLRNDSDIQKLQGIGCLFQINVYSVFDEENEEIKRNAIKLVKEKRVAFLGSDAHRTIHRPPSVKYGLQFLYDYFEKNYIDQIAFGNAEKLLGLME